MNSQRQNVILAIILVMMTMMSGRLCFLHIFHHHFLQNQGDARALRTIGVSSYRGMITDRLGVPLAVSTPVDSVWANPSEVVITEKNWGVLAKIIKIEKKKLINKLQDQKNHKKEFLYLMRQLHPDIIQKIKS